MHAYKLNVTSDLFANYTDTPYAFTQ